MDESVHAKMFLASIRRAFLVDIRSCVSNSAPHNSSLGINNCLDGVTLVLAMSSETVVEVSVSDRLFLLWHLSRHPRSRDVVFV